MVMRAHYSSPVAAYPAPPVLNPVPTILPARQHFSLNGPVLETAHLRLRRWDSKDLVPFVMLCRDPEIMQFFNGMMSPVACFEEIERQEACFDMYQYGIWAVELKGSNEFIGAIGIEPTMMKAKGMTARITWKLRKRSWGLNYAFEAGQAVIEYAFNELKAKNVLALVEPDNARSLRLVERLGFKQQGKNSTSYAKTTV